MPSQPPGNPNARGSAYLPVSEHDLQLTEHHVPILAPCVPVLNNTLRCQIQHPPQRIVVGERRLVLGDLAELPVQSLDNIRRVYDFPNLRRIFKEGVQNFPVVFPALYTGRILTAPFFCEVVQLLRSFFFSYCGVDLLQIGYQLLDIWNCQEKCSLKTHKF